MSYNAAGVKVVSILGEDYSIKAPAGEEQTLLDAAMTVSYTHLTLPTIYSV